MNQEENEVIIQAVLDEVVKIAAPELVILYSTKYDMDGELRSFKLCIVCDFKDKRQLLSKIFDVDCEVPFDVILYTQDQFLELREDEEAFASRVFRKGKILYGKQ